MNGDLQSWHEHREHAWLETEEVEEWEIWDRDLEKRLAVTLAEYFPHFWGEIGPTQRYNNLPVAAPSKPEVLRQLYKDEAHQYSDRSYAFFC